MRFLIGCLIVWILGAVSGCAAVKAGLTTDLPNALKWAGDRIDAPQERGDHENE